MKRWPPTVHSLCNADHPLINPTFTLTSWSIHAMFTLFPELMLLLLTATILCTTCAMQNMGTVEALKGWAWPNHKRTCTWIVAISELHACKLTTARSTHVTTVLTSFSYLSNVDCSAQTRVNHHTPRSWRWVRPAPARRGLSLLAHANYAGHHLRPSPSPGWYNLQHIDTMNML